MVLHAGLSGMFHKPFLGFFGFFFGIFVFWIFFWKFLKFFGIFCNGFESFLDFLEFFGMIFGLVLAGKSREGVLNQKISGGHGLLTHGSHASVHKQSQKTRPVSAQHEALISLSVRQQMIFQMIFFISHSHVYQTCTHPSFYWCVPSGVIYFRFTYFTRNTCVQCRKCIHQLQNT